MANRRLIRKLALALAGGSLVLLGIVGLILPIMPGFIFLIPGLFLLSLEFAWADRALIRVKRFTNRRSQVLAAQAESSESDIEGSR